MNEGLQLLAYLSVIGGVPLIILLTIVGIAKWRIKKERKETYHLFTPRTAFEILKPGKEATTLQMSKEPYLGMWLAVEGEVYDIHVSYSGKVALWSHAPVDSLLLYFEKDEWLRILENVNKGDKFTAVGEIELADKNYITMRFCELRSINGNPINGGE